MVMRRAAMPVRALRIKRARPYHVVIDMPSEPMPQVAELPSPRWWKIGNYLTGVLFLLVTKIGAFSPSPLIWSTVIAVIIRSLAYGFYPKSELPKVTMICNLIGWISTVLAVALLTVQVILFSSKI